MLNTLWTACITPGEAFRDNQPIKTTRILAFFLPLLFLSGYVASQALLADLEVTVGDTGAVRLLDNWTYHAFSALITPLGFAFIIWVQASVLFVAGLWYGSRHGFDRSFAVSTVAAVPAAISATIWLFIALIVPHEARIAVRTDFGMMFGLEGSILRWIDVADPWSFYIYAATLRHSYGLSLQGSLTLGLLLTSIAVVFRSCTLWL